MLETNPQVETSLAASRSCSGKRGFDFSPWTSLPPLSTQDESGNIASGPGAIERFVALVGLTFASPLLFLIGVAIKIESPGGPIFYRQERVGFDRRRRNGDASGSSSFASTEERRRTPGSGQRFMIWKFRTMVPDAEARTGPVWAMQNDPRITRVGRALRYLRFDELPQLINVVLGDMRLIGPRPERPQFVESLTKAVPEYPRRHTVPPGITGLAQVQRDYDSDLDDVRTKLKYDLYYVDHQCPMLNLKILMKTLDVVVRGRGAH